MKENVLKRELRLKGMTMEMLAEKLGIFRQSITKWTTGKTNPSPKMILKLREAGISEETIYDPSAEFKKQ